MKSHWDYSLTDSTGDLKGYHAHCLKLMSLITCFAKTPEQAERLFKASPLYKPEIWNKDYKNEFSWVKDFLSKVNLTEKCCQITALKIDYRKIQNGNIPVKQKVMIKF